jgi:hypothetical protein
MATALGVRLLNMVNLRVTVFRLICICKIHSSDLPTAQMRQPIFTLISSTNAICANDLSFRFQEDNGKKTYLGVKSPSFRLSVGKSIINVFRFNFALIATHITACRMHITR